MKENSSTQYPKQHPHAWLLQIIKDTDRYQNSFEVRGTTFHAANLAGIWPVELTLLYESGDHRVSPTNLSLPWHILKEQGINGWMVCNACCLYNWTT